MSLDRRRFLQFLAVLGTTLPSGLKPVWASSGRHMRKIPSSNEYVPAIGLGSWLSFSINVNDEAELKQRTALMKSFLDNGGGVLDSSPMYGVAQEVIGKCLSRIDQKNGLFSATKVWTRGNRQGLLQMEESRNLWGLNRLDLMQVHNLLDWETHLPTLQAMKADGEIRYVGVTTSHGRRHDKLLQIMRTQDIDFVQFTYNMLDREAEDYLLPLAADRGIAVIINRPFQRAGLFDKFADSPLPDWASEIDCENWAQFFLKFIISHPSVTCAIPATSRIDHLQQNMSAGYGVLPDQPMRRKMVDYLETL